MIIDFNFIKEITMPGMNDGTGVMHICPKGSSHSIINTGEDSLVMLTIVVADRDRNTEGLIVNQRLKKRMKSI